MKKRRSVPRKKPPPSERHKPVKAGFPFLTLALILLISIVGIWPLFSSTAYATHDGVSHLARFSQFINSFRDGQFLVRWLPGFMEGYGLPIYLIYPPLPAYFVTLFYLLGFSLIASFKAVLILTVPLSGVAMFFFAREFLSKHAALLAAAAYMLAPYRFIDIYIRGAFNECVTFIFIPLIFLFIKKVSEGRYRFLPYLALSLAALVLSHSPTPLMLMPFILGYALFAARIGNRRHSVYFLALGILLGFGLSSFHLLVAFIERSYTVIGTSAGFLSDFFNFRRSFIQPVDLISPFWGYGMSGKSQTYGMPYQLGSIYLLCAILSVAAVRHVADRAFKYTIVFFQIMLAICVLMMFQISQPLWEILPLISFLQFPWRFLAPATFAGAFLVGALPEFLALIKNWQTPTTAVLLLISPLVALVFILRDEWPFLTPFLKLELFLWLAAAIFIWIFYGKLRKKQARFTAIFLMSVILSAIPIAALPLHIYIWDEPGSLGKTETQRKLLARKLPRTLPIGTANDLGFLPKTVKELPKEGPAGPVQFITGDAYIDMVSKKSDKMSFKVHSSKGGQAAINIFHFPGWGVYLNGNKTAHSIDHYGRMVVDFPAGEQTIEVRFEDTPLRKTADFISIASIVVLIITAGILKRKSFFGHSIKTKAK